MITITLVEWKIVNVYPVPIQLSFNWDQNCVVPENNHTPATEGIENSWGGGGILKGPNTCINLVNVWSSTGISREVRGGGVGV